MKALPVIIGIVIILTLVSLPGAAIMSKADLIASYPVPGPKRPESYSCCSDDTFRGLNYTDIDAADGGGSPEPAPPVVTPYIKPEPTPTVSVEGGPRPVPASLEELIASYSVKPYSDPITCCDDCTPPQQWIKGTVTPEPALDIYDRFWRTTGNTFVPGPPFPSLENLAESYGGEWWMKGRRPEPVKCCASGNTSMPTSLFETMSFSDDEYWINHSPAPSEVVL